VERLLEQPGRRVHLDVGRKLLADHGWAMMVNLDLGNWIAHSLGRRQALLDTIGIAVTADKSKKKIL
jgi:hypothetical protein